MACSGWWGRGVATHTSDALLNSLNNNCTLDASISLNKYIYDDDSIGQLFQTQIKSEYHDITSFANKYKNNTDPLIISINIQSINSKYDALKTYVCQLDGLGIQADIILLQETWEVKFPKHFHLPGYQTIIARTRVGMRGGGVGFFVRDGLHFKERTEYESHTEKTFENLVLEVTFPNKTIIFSNIYRSPTPPVAPLLQYIWKTSYLLLMLTYHYSRIPIRQFMCS